MVKLNLAVVIPVYNDWKSLSLLVPGLDRVLEHHDVDITLVVVNDASTRSEQDWIKILSNFKTVKQIDIVNLTCNVGHQRAVAIGLVEVSKKTNINAVVVMDADGEDKPEDVSILLDSYRAGSGSNIVVARRDKRSEGLIFRLCYSVYKIIFRILTGKTVGFGNFCLIPFQVLNRLVYRDSLWNHLSATILRSKLAITEIPTQRGKRLDGDTKMNFGDLVLLGLSAISVYIDKVFLRTLFFSAFLCDSDVTVIIAVTLIRFFTDLAIPGWASGMVGSLLVILILSFLLSIFVLFIVLANRSQVSMLPAKYASEYINRVDTVYNR
jgi:glycosyltransferase involved in cell wall biosynthesis